jgi:hypothetical protein
MQRAMPDPPEESSGTDQRWCHSWLDLIYRFTLPTVTWSAADPLM